MLIAGFLPNISCEGKDFVATWFPGFPLLSHPALHSQRGGGLWPSPRSFSIETPTRAKFKGTIIQSTEIVIMLQFLGPEMESSISQMFRPRNCGNAAVYFWAQKLSKCCNFWAQKLQKSCNFRAQKLQLCCNLISGPRNCRNAAISGPRNCGYAREILYRFTGNT